MNALRLIYVTSRAPFGRDETFVMEEVRGLRERGHDVRVVPLLPRGDLLHAAGRELLPVTEACWPWSARVLGGALLELVRAPVRSLRALALLLTSHPRNLVANLCVYPKALWLARRARALGTQHIHAHWATTTSAMAMAAAEVAGIPWSFTAHRYDLHRNDLFARKARRAAFTRVISRHGEREARHLAGPDGAEIVNIHMGVPLPEKGQIRFCDQKKGQIHFAEEKKGQIRFCHEKMDLTLFSHEKTDLTLFSRKTPVLFCPARLIAFKNHEGLLNAFAQVTARAELWLAGDGPRRGDIEAQIRYLGLRNVRLLGALPNEDVLALYRKRRVDAVILASSDEGIPVALMEAMAAGVPVIATAVGGVPELVGMGAGMLVPPGDEGRLTWAIEELLRDAALRARLSQAARARVARRFSLERSIDRLERRFAAHAHGAAGSLSTDGIRKRTRAAYSRKYATATPIAAIASTPPSPHAASPTTTGPTSSGPA